jgi:hypothetical protein
MKFHAEQTEPGRLACINWGVPGSRAMTKRLFILLPLALATGVAAAPPEPVTGLIRSHCIDCHDDSVAKGDLDLTSLAFEPAEAANRERWIRVIDRVAKGEMPPPKKADGFSSGDRRTFLNSLQPALLKADREDLAAHGRGPVRRLTREEYENNLRDLLRLPHLDVRDLLPEDREARGFTRVSALLDLSRVQLAAYLDAAEAALTSAMASGVAPPPMVKLRMTGTDLFPATTSFGGREAMFFAKHGRMLPLNGADLGKMSAEERRDPEIEAAIFRSATWPYFGYPKGFRAKQDGAYRVRFSARAVRQVPDFRLVPAHEPVPMSFRARQPSGPDVSGDVRETGGWMDILPEAKDFETIIRLKRGETFEYSVLGLPVPFIRTDGGFYYDFPPMEREGHRGVAIRRLEVEGPLSGEEWPPASHRALFGDLPIRPATKGSALGVEVVSTNAVADAERLFAAFARRAARKPLAPEALAAFQSLIHARLEAGAPFAEAVLAGCQAFLCSPHFVCLHAPDAAPDNPFALASRLAHLLTSSGPDQRLRELAADDRLRSPQLLRAETERLIASPTFERFVVDFTDQWLDLRDLRRDMPDNRLYPEYRKDDYLVASMEAETRAFVRALLRDNLPVTTLVDAEFAFVNDRLARHYDLPRLGGSAMRRVALPEWSPHGGLLTQAAVLKLTANGTTTSPVVRGAWVMEKLLGDPPPPPPKSVPAIAPDIRGATTIREQLAKHTASESCASCHARFDPVGFALENFDVMGAWRDRYRAMERGEKITGIDPAGHPYAYHVGPPVEPAGRLLDGREFADIRELKGLLATQPRPLARNLLEHLTLYATGTPVRFADRPIIEDLLDRSEPAGYRARDLLLGLITSPVFTGQHLNPPRAENAAGRDGSESR